MQKVFLILFVGVLGIWVSQQTLKTSVVDDVLLENVEALANGEVFTPILCRFSGDYVCPDNNDRVAIIYQGYSLR